MRRNWTVKNDYKFRNESFVILELETIFLLDKSCAPLRLIFFAMSSCILFDMHT